MSTGTEEACRCSFVRRNMLLGQWDSKENRGKRNWLYKQRPISHEKKKPGSLLFIHETNHHRTWNINDLRDVTFIYDTFWRVLPDGSRWISWLSSCTYNSYLKAWPKKGDTKTRISWNRLPRGLFCFLSTHDEKKANYGFHTTYNTRDGSSRNH